MPEVRIVQFNSVWGGQSPSQYYAGDGQYLIGIGIDPFLPISDSAGDRRSSGVLRPSAYAKFSSTVVDGYPIWIGTVPELTNIYSVLQNGDLVSHSSAFGSETLVGTVTGTTSGGAAYYNNYLYIATGTDVSRYGPLDGTPAITNTVWTGTTLGSQTALVDTTYPTLRGVELPNHPMHTHIDGKLYVGDYDSTSSTDTTRGKGLIHAISTKFSTTEGTGNNGSTYNVLDLPPGWMPIAIESYGNDLVIAAFQTTNATLTQGRSALFFWNTIDQSFDNIVYLPDSLVTALKNVNGQLFVFSGSISNGAGESNGYRVSVFVGGQSIQTLFYSDTGCPPFPSGVEAIGDRVYWGTFETVQTTTPGTPTYYCVVKALGTKNPAVPAGVHSVAKSSVTATNNVGMITAIRQVQQSSLSFPKVVIGWGDGTNYGIDNQSTTYTTSVWLSPLVHIGQRFTIRRVRIPLAVAIATNMTITPKIFLDDFSSSSTDGLTVVNSTNYSGSERVVELFPMIGGVNNFVLELTWSGTALIPCLLPIEIELEVWDT